MGNHFHLLLETPEPNLVSGMRVLPGSFAQVWNRQRNRRGHVFRGRYKSIPVSGERASDSFQFRIVADSIHLNPARAGLVGGAKGKLVAYEWSSLKHYSKGTGPEWLVRDRVPEAFELAKDGRGRRGYLNDLEKRAAEQGGELSPEAMAELRRNCYPGDEKFRDWLLGMMKESSGVLKKTGSHFPDTLRSHGEVEAKRIVRLGKRYFEIDGTRGEGKPKLRKGDARKVAIAMVVKRKTNVGNRWIAEALEMGHPQSVSRLIKQGNENRKTQKDCRKLEKMLNTTDPGSEGPVP
jgi:hypothetical protein